MLQSQAKTVRYIHPVENLVQSLCFDKDMEQDCHGQCCGEICTSHSKTIYLKQMETSRLIKIEFDQVFSNACLEV